MIWNEDSLLMAGIMIGFFVPPILVGVGLGIKSVVTWIMYVAHQWLKWQRRKRRSNHWRVYRKSGLIDSKGGEI